MNDKCNYQKLLNQQINFFFRQAIKTIAQNPARSKFLWQTIRSQKKAAKRRHANARQGVPVPTFMIVSVTNRCNLHCRGCYAQAQHRPAGEEIDSARIRALLHEASELGVSFVFLAGGEPLLRPDLLTITRELPQVIFPLFTNGLLLNDEIRACLQGQQNVVPVLSIEGYQQETDLRRGEGVYQRLEQVMRELQQMGQLFGVSFTVDQANYAYLTDENLINGLMAAGCQLFFYVEYVPVQEDTVALVITEQQREELAVTLAVYREKFQALFISFPGDEEIYGGCLAAGRGFIHISAAGDVEPCPFAPYADTNLKQLTLREALQSELLRKIRENHDMLTDTAGGCALWEKREWLKSLR
jgi:MoaA/NifB/PqqE/SkfB family radical SAM enzyme